MSWQLFPARYRAAMSTWSAGPELAPEVKDIEDHHDMEDEAGRRTGTGRVTRICGVSWR